MINRKAGGRQREHHRDNESETKQGVRDKPRKRKAHTRRDIHSEREREKRQKEPYIDTREVERETDRDI